MSSILIRGVDDPKNCSLCICCDKDTRYCKASERYIQTFEDVLNYKPDFCPIVVVHTPHGRLVDIDAAKKCLDELSDCEDKHYAIGLFDWATSKRVVVESED